MHTMENKTDIAIIGGGIGGVMAALFLSRTLKFNRSRNLYNITIYEKEHAILKGASNELARLHFGGEYPRDPSTAQDCVTGAILFSQIFPSSVYSAITGVDYLVSAKNDDKEELLEKLVHHYETFVKPVCTRFYAQLHNKADFLFGDVATLFRKIEPVELTENFFGGIHSNELGFNSSALNTFLHAKIKEEEIDVKYSVAITDAAKNGDTYILTAKDVLTEKEQNISAGIVVNASWENCLALNYKIKKEVPAIRGYWRALAIADISRCDGANDSKFALIGKSGGMYSPVNDKKAILYVPEYGCSFINDENNECHLFSETNLIMKKPVISDSEIEERKQKIHEHISSLFPFLKNMIIVGLPVNPTFSKDDELHKRAHIKTWEVGKNWFSVFPAKATFAVRAAIELIALMPSVSSEALKGFCIDTHPVVPAIFHLK